MVEMKNSTFPSRMTGILVESHVVKTRSSTSQNVPNRIETSEVEISNFFLEYLGSGKIELKFDQSFLCQE